MDNNPLSNCRPLYTLRFYQTKLVYLVALTRVLFQGSLPGGSVYVPPPCSQLQVLLQISVLTSNLVDPFHFNQLLFLMPIHCTINGAKAQRGPEVGSPLKHSEPKRSESKGDVKKQSELKESESKESVSKQSKH